MMVFCFSVDVGIKRMSTDIMMDSNMTSKSRRNGNDVVLDCSLVLPDMSMMSVILWEFSPLGTDIFIRIVTRWPHYKYTQFEALGMSLAAERNVTSDFSLTLRDVFQSASGIYRCGMMDSKNTMFGNATFLNITGKVSSQLIESIINTFLFGYVLPINWEHFPNVNSFSSTS